MALVCLGQMAPRDFYDVFVEERPSEVDQDSGNHGNENGSSSDLMMDASVNG